MVHIGLSSNSLGNVFSNCC